MFQEEIDRHDIEKIKEYVMIHAKNKDAHDVFELYITILLHQKKCCNCAFKTASFSTEQKIDDSLTYIFRKHCTEFHVPLSDGNKLLMDHDQFSDARLFTQLASTREMAKFIVSHDYLANLCIKFVVEFFPYEVIHELAREKGMSWYDYPELITKALRMNRKHQNDDP